MLFLLGLAAPAVDAASAKLEKLAFGTGIEDVGASTFNLVGEGDRFLTSTTMIWCFCKAHYL